MDSKVAENSAESETTARKLAFLVAIPALVYVDWNMGFTLLNPHSAGAFLVFMGVPVFMAIRHKSQAIGFISRASVAIGMIVSSLNTINLFTEMSDLESSMFASRLVFAPLALGVLVSYLLPLVDTAEPKPKLVLSKTEQIITAALTLMALYIVWVFIFKNQSGFATLIDANPVVISVVVTAICMVYPGNEKLGMQEKATKSGLFVCVIAAVLGVAFYSGGVAMGPRFMGPAAAVGVMASLYGSILVYVATILGGQNSMDAKEARYFDWHLIESWVFLALMLLAPMTIFEFLG